MDRRALKMQVGAAPTLHDAVVYERISEAPAFLQGEDG
jgi:hypothetical protein